METLALTGAVPQHVGTSLSGGIWQVVSTASPTKLTFAGGDIQTVGAGTTWN